MTESTVLGDQCPLPAEHGSFYWGDSLDVVSRMPADSVDLLVFSPPFDGGTDLTDHDRSGESLFLGWFLPFFEQFRRVLRRGGCVVFELGGVWLADSPGKSMQHAAAINGLASVGWRLVQDFFWYNPQLIHPEPFGALRAKDSVTPIWVLSASNDVRFDVTALDRPLLRGNLLELGSAEPDHAYEAALAGGSVEPYIDRWPTSVPTLFIELLTEPGGLVVDPFAGTGATCLAAERLGRRWIGVERNRSLEPHVRAMFG
jgi:hypothetical protein